LGGNSITDISALKNNTQLRKLHLAINQVEDITALSSLNHLSSLYLAKNKVKDIRPLLSLSGLHVLNSGMDFDEAPLEVQRWFLNGNPIDPQFCPKGDSTAAVLLFCSQYQ
ncbi:MAG: leucine-rich repeat domain-containing protein, partial [Myxococcota bacterium]|nr:leucine-rich repeat domain-containing protein [Myxococcota bacterium]